MKLFGRGRRAAPRSSGRGLRAAPRFRFWTSVAILTIAPVVVSAPKPDPEAGGSLEEILAEAKASGLEGWELADRAAALVAGCYSHESRWHLWESPRRSLARGRGRSTQYNVVLGRVLRGLGFQIRIVHASRVRRPMPEPWWCAGHTWVEVTHAGVKRDLDASAAMIPGDGPITPVAEVRPFRWWTFVDTAVAMWPFSSAEVWRHWVTRDPIPDWLYRPVHPSVVSSDPRQS